MNKHNYIKIPIEKWCKFCDTLNVSPDTNIDDIIYKAEILQAELLKLRRERYLAEHQSGKYGANFHESQIMMVEP